MLPYLRSERAPHWDALPRGALRRACAPSTAAATSSARRSRASASSWRSCSTPLRDAGYEIREVRATGGFVRSALWKEILADALGVGLTSTGVREGSALGAAMLAREALGR